MKPFLAAVLLAAVLLAGCGRTDRTQGDALPIRQVTIAIDPGERIFLNERDVTLEELGTLLQGMAVTEQLEVLIHVAPTASVGIVNDVTNQIPQVNVANVRFAEPEM